jgi:hypothetical protein
MVPSMCMCISNIYKYLLLEFMYMICVNVSYDYVFVYILQVTTVALAEWSDAWTVFDRLEAVIAGSNSTLGMDV